MNSIIQMLRFSPVAFAVTGMICGLIISADFLVAFVCLGACMGAAIGIITAVMCLVANQKSYVSMAALACNLILFVVIAREMQLM